MNPKSLENLTGKSKRGFMSRQSSNQLRQIIYNALETTRLETIKYDDHKKNKKEKTVQNNALPSIHTPPSQRPNANARGVDCGSANVPHNQEKKTEVNKITEGDDSTLPTHEPLKVLFFTLTTNWDSTELEYERMLFKEFRWFCKKLGHSYVWKCEKDTEAHQHYHILIFVRPIDTEGVTSHVKYTWMDAINRLRTNYDVAHYNKYRHIAASMDVRPLDMLDDSTPICVAHYFAKQTDFPIDGKIFSMSNDMQRFKPTVENDPNVIKSLQYMADILAIENADNVEASKWAVFSSDYALEKSRLHFSEVLKGLNSWKNG